jgi:Protein of unknown function (DUF4246)
MQMSALAEEYRGSWYFLPGSEPADPKTLLEKHIDAFTSALRDKENWKRKCHDRVIVQKWTEEAKQQGMSAEAVDFAMQVCTALLARAVNPCHDTLMHLRRSLQHFLLQQRCMHMGIA